MGYDIQERPTGGPQASRWGLERYLNWKSVLDVSVVVKSAAGAKALCFKLDQKAYFDLKAGKEVPVNSNATSGGVLKEDSMSNTKPTLVLMPGKVALTMEGMERMCKAMTGKPFTAQDRILAQQTLDAAEVPQPGLTRPVKNL